MKSKKGVFRVVSLLLVLCFVSTVMISGTFAKYTSTYAGQDTALIAKWSLDVKDGEGHGFAISPAAVVNLDLFSHKYDVNILNKVGEDDDYIIAPGVKGSFGLAVTNNSDVAAKVEFAFTESGESVPIEYSLDGVTYDSLTVLKTALNGLSQFTEVGVGEEDPATQTVYWRWPYEVGVGDDLVASDEEDTELGKDSATAAAGVGGSRTNYILTITATATQIAPTTP